MSSGWARLVARNHQALVQEQSVSKTKTAAAFALGFIVGSSRWLWISVLVTGVVHVVLWSVKCF